MIRHRRFGPNAPKISDRRMDSLRCHARPSPAVAGMPFAAFPLDSWRCPTSTRRSDTAMGTQTPPVAPCIRPHTSGGRGCGSTGYFCALFPGRSLVGRKWCQRGSMRATTAIRALHQTLTRRACSSLDFTQTLRSMTGFPLECGPQGNCS